MKLYLSSYKIGDRGAELANLLSGRKRMAIVTNALDFSTDLERLRVGRERESDALNAIGISSVALDLRDYFGTPHTLKDALLDVDGIWVVGGNTFILRRAMSLSGLDAILRERADDDAFVYAGYSAGACVLAPTLKGIHLADEPAFAPEGYPKEILWDGLGLIPFCIVPHYHSNHPESLMMNQVVAYYTEHQIPFITLRDGEVYVGEAKGSTSL